MRGKHNDGRSSKAMNDMQIRPLYIRTASHSPTQWEADVTTEILAGASIVKN